MDDLRAGAVVTWAEKLWFITYAPLPAGFSAQWVRLVADKACTATAMFTYN